MKVEEREKIIATLWPVTSNFGGYISETFCTFLFISVILMVKNPLTAVSKDGWYGAFTVGIALLACICLAGGHTGAALNPAVGLAQVVYQNWQYD